MLQARFIAVLLGLVCVACGKDKVEDAKLQRSGDGPAVVVVGGPVAKAGMSVEVEPNDETPQAIEAGKGVSGVLDGALDLDRYSLVIAERGMLFALASGADDADLMVELLDGEAKSLATSDRGPAKTSEGVAGMALEPGTYQILVSEFTKKKLRKSGARQGASQPYELRVRLQVQPEVSYELEDNADVAGASEIVVGEERFGYLGWKDDSDLWRLPIVGFDSVDIEEGANRAALHVVLSPLAGVDATLRLLAPDGRLLLERKSAKGQEVAIRNLVPEVSAESYIVQVLSGRSNPEEPYVLRVEDAEIPPGSEEEPNDTPESATPLVGGTGTLITASGEVCLGDLDIFTISPSTSARVLELDLVGPGDAQLEISIVAESGAVLGTVAAESNGLPLTLTSIPIAANMAPLVRIRATTLKAPANYKLTMSLVVGTVLAPLPDAIPGVSE